MAYAKGQPGCDGRMTTEKPDMSGMTASGDPKGLSHRGRARAKDLSGEGATERSSTPDKALAEFGGASSGPRLGSLKGDGEPITIPKEGEAADNNRPIR